MEQDSRNLFDGLPRLNGETERMLSGLRGNACFFTGHRVIPTAVQRPLTELLDEEISALIYQGFTTFLCGAARGFDLMAASAVLRQQRTHAAVRLILAIPCPEQNRGWRQDEQQLYRLILSRGEPILLSEVYHRDCMRKRNCFMVDHAVMGLSYFVPTNPYSGTAQTLRYAELNRIPIINLADLLQKELT